MVKTLRGCGALRRRALLALAAALLAGCTGEGAQAVYVIRHFDTPEGVRDAALTDRGHARAKALVRWFAGRPLGAVYATPFKRTRQTAASLLAERGLTATDYDWQQADALVAAVRARGGDVLIVGHSNTVPEIVERFGGTRPPPLIHSDFGDIWIIRDGRSERMRVEP